MNLFGKLQSQYEQLWKHVIRPQRSAYSVDMLGPTDFRLQNINVIRRDFQVMDTRQLSFQGSIWLPSNSEQYNVMIYLHSNIGSRTQGMQYLGQLIKNNIALCTFDFPSCGNAEGQYVTMGYYEQQDIRSVIKHIKKMMKIRNIALWGRSMGAVSALLYLTKTIEIQAVILDSPFKNLKSYVQQLAKKKFKIPSLLISGATKIISKTIQQKANFSIYNINPLKYSVPGLHYPVMFIAALEDQCIPNQHIKQLFTAYGGQNKQIKYIKGQHNDMRPEECVNQIINFALQNFSHDWKEEINNKPKKDFDFFEMQKLQEKQKQQHQLDEMNYFDQLERVEKVQQSNKTQRQTPKQSEFSLTSMFTSLFSRDKKKQKQKSKQVVLKDGYQQTRKILAKKFQNHQSKLQTVKLFERHELAQKLKNETQSTNLQSQSNLKQWVMFTI